MKLTDKTLALLVEGDPAEVEVLHFVRSPPISQVGHSSLHRCRRLVSLSLARLGLRTIDGDALAACATLWWIDLSRNHLETLAGSGLDAFAALGLLDVSGNAVAIDAIASIGEVEVVRLHLAGNPGAADRAAALAAAPAAWVLDGRLVTADERNTAELARAESSTPTGEPPPLARLGGEDWIAGAAAPARLAHHRLVAAEQPTAPARRDVYRAKHALADYECEVALRAAWARTRPAATRPPLPPPTRRDRLNALDGARRVDAACLLWASVATKGVERRILVDALGTLVGSAAAQDVANLAPFVRQGLYAGLRDAALREVAENQSLDDRRVLAALPPVPAAEAPDGLEALKPAAARAARLLAEADGRPRSRSTHARANADGGLATLRSWGGQEVLTLAPDEAPVALRYEAPQKADDLAKLRQPRPGEGVEVFDSVFTVVVDAAPHVVRLKPFAGINGDPYFGHAAVDRKSLWWDPRGWWRHVHAAKQQTLLFRAEQRARLHRVNDSAHRSGHPCGLGLVNAAVPVPAETFDKRLARPVALFSADAAPVAAFVVAPPAAVVVQNAYAPPEVAWSRLEDAPRVVLRGTGNDEAPRMRHWSRARPNKPAAGSSPSTTVSPEDASALEREMGHLRAANRLFRKKWCAVQERALRLRRSAPSDVVESTPPAESSVFALTALDRSPGKVEARMVGASLDANAASGKPLVAAAPLLRRQSQPWSALANGGKLQLAVAAPSSPQFFSRTPSRGSAVASTRVDGVVSAGSARFGPPARDARYASSEIDASHALPSRPARKAMPKCARWPDSDYSLIDRFKQECLSKELGLTAGDKSTLRISRPGLLKASPVDAPRCPRTGIKNK